MSAYYNEHDRNAAAWLRELITAGLIAPGDVDERDIRDIRPSELRGYTQCHFFAGIGGWSLALRLAGWGDDRPVWTGSCPCQAFSSASRGRATAADLWPEFRRLILGTRPPVVFGEQVARAVRWFDGVCDDLEAAGYAVGAAILPATAVGFDHARPRIYFVCDTDRDGESGVSIDAEVAGLPRGRGDAGGLGPSHGISLRMVAFSGFGNAIVPVLGAEFISAYLKG